MSNIKISHVQVYVAISLVDEGHLFASFPGALNIMVCLVTQQISFKNCFGLI